MADDLPRPDVDVTPIPDGSTGIYVVISRRDRDGDLIGKSYRTTKMNEIERHKDIVEQINRGWIHCRVDYEKMNMTLAAHRAAAITARTIIRRLWASLLVAIGSLLVMAVHITWQALVAAALARYWSFYAGLPECVPW